MIWVNYIFGFLLFTAITCSPAISLGETQFNGKPVVKNPNDPKYLELANLSMKKYKSDVGSKENYVVIKVTTATEQLVAGLITEINFYALVSSRQNPHSYIRHTDRVLECHSSIYEVSWLNKREVTVSCVPAYTSM